MVIIASSTPNMLQAFNSHNNNNNNNSSGNNHLRDPSFSSYLKTNEEETFSESRKDSLLQGVKKEEEEDGEIGVFSAEKYFNNGLGEEVVPNITDTKKKFEYNHHYRKDEQQQQQQTSPDQPGKYNNKGIKHGSPSLRSESSWNSQSALLQSSARESSRNKARRKSFLSSLGSKYCSCSNKNSVDVSDRCSGEAISTFNKTSSKKHLNTDHRSVKAATKPQAEDLLISNSNNIEDVYYFQKQEKLNRENSSASISTAKMELQEAERQRKSLEVFGSPILDSRIKKSLSFDKRLTIMPQPNLEVEIGNNNYDDDESDASSDLFEIDSLTGNSNNNPFLIRPKPDSAGCASPTNGYAPSEASIEWSVVTASAVEYSATLDFEDQRSVATTRSPIRPNSASSNGKPTKVVSKEIQRRRPTPSMLLGCKNHKAVGVAVDAFATCEKPISNNNNNNRGIRHRPETFAQVTRFQAERKEGNLGARQQGYATPPPAPLQRSPRASQLLYI